MPEPTDPPPPPVASAPTSARLRVAAVAILVVGLLVSVGIWVAAGDDDVPAGTGTSWRITGGQVDQAADSAARDRQTERLGGRALVRTAAFDRWLGSLWHGRRLAWTLAALATLLAAACAGIAALNDLPGDE